MFETYTERARLALSRNYSDFRTTMIIYTHVLIKGGRGAKAPLTALTDLLPIYLSC
jgi:hypothetical protein